MASTKAHVEKLEAAQKLLTETTTSREKFSAIHSIVKGVHPKIDWLFTTAEKHLSTIDKIQEGEFTHLSAEHLPEITEEEKKRKKAILFFIESLKDLKSEIARVRDELLQEQLTQNNVNTTSIFGRIVRYAKGPLGLITLIAIGAVVMQQTSVTIKIVNTGCATLIPSGTHINLPGLSFPSAPIPSGGSALMTLPPLTITVDGTDSQKLILSSLKFTFTFELPPTMSALTLDDQSLLGKKSIIKLSEKASHELKLMCSKS